jgi:uncharacterized protein YdhG (YjbR/CyaY superfamily)
MASIDAAVREYIDAIPPEYRPLFDRVNQVILTTFPEATVVLSYKMPTYRVEDRRLYVGVWKHGLSIYGWPQGCAEFFLANHQALRTSKGTIRLGIDDAKEITDVELRDLARAALSGTAEVE